MKNILYFAKLVGVNLAIVMGGVVLVELIFGTWFSEAHALYQFTKPRNFVHVQPNPFGDTPAQIRYTRDENGFRGLDAPVSDIDIITVGGSTTDQRYLDDEATYQAVLKHLFAQSGRPLHIANAGIDGQSTVGHIHNFASWFGKIDGLKTHYILYYVGINDMLRLQGDETYDVLQVSDWRKRWQLYIREKSVLYQMYLVAKQALEPNPYSHGAHRDYVVDVSEATDKANVPNYRTKQILERLDALRHRVDELDRLTRQMGAHSIFVTQRSARWTDANGKIVGIPHYLAGDQSEFRMLGDVTGVDIYNIERLVADSILQQCKADGAICLDLMSDLKFDIPDDFYDHIHTTSSGASKIGQYLFERLHSRI